MITFLLYLYVVCGIVVLIWYLIKWIGKALVSPYTLYKTFMDDGISPQKSFLIVVIFLFTIGSIVFTFLFFY